MSSELLPVAHEDPEYTEAARYAESILIETQRAVSKLPSRSPTTAEQTKLKHLLDTWDALPQNTDGVFVQYIDTIEIDEAPHYRYAIGESAELTALNEAKTRIEEAPSRTEALNRRKHKIAGWLGPAGWCIGTYGALTETLDDSTVIGSVAGGLALTAYNLHETGPKRVDKKIDAVETAIKTTISESIENADVVLSDYAPLQLYTDERSNIQILESNRVVFEKTLYDTTNAVGVSFRPVYAVRAMLQQDEDPSELWESMLHDEVKGWSELQTTTITLAGALDVAIERLQLTGIESHDGEINGLRKDYELAQEQLNIAFRQTIYKYNARVSEQHTIALANKLLSEHSELLDSIIDVSESHLEHPCRETLFKFRNILFDIALNIDTQNDEQINTFRAMVEYVKTIQNLLTDSSQAKQIYHGLTVKFGNTVTLPEWQDIEDDFISAAIAE